MNYHDLLLVKPSDIQLFKAPEYFKYGIQRGHRYSYLGIFGNFYRYDEPVSGSNSSSSFGAVLIPRARRQRKTPIIQLPWFWGGLDGACSDSFATEPPGRCEISSNKSSEEDVPLFSITFFLIVFLLMPFVHYAGLFGYGHLASYCPLCFTWQFLLLMTKSSGGKSYWWSSSALSLRQCGIEAVMLT
jgi:hypothetical protein